MADAVTLADLISTSTEEELYDALLVGLRARGVPVDSWADDTDLGVGLTHMVSEQETETRGGVAALANSGFLDYATGDGLTLYAKSDGQLERYPAVATSGWLLLTSVSTAPQHDRVAGDLTAGTPGRTGLVYSSTTAGTLSAGGRLLVKFTAAEPGPSYNLGLTANWGLRTSLVGADIEAVQVLEVPGEDADGGVVYGVIDDTDPVAIEHIEAGVSTALSVSVATVDGTKVITVNLETNAGSEAISTAEEVADFIQTSGTAGAIAARALVYAQAMGTGLSVASAIEESLLSTWITEQGAEEEADGTISPPSGLKGRVATLRATTGAGGNEEALIFWALARPIGYTTSPVSRVKCFSNQLGGVAAASAGTILIAGTAGALAASVVEDVAANFEGATEDYPDATHKKYALGCQISVETTTNLTLALTGVVYVLRAGGYSASEVQSLVEAALASYQAQLDIGGQGGLVYVTQKVGPRIESAAPDSIRNVALTNSATTAVDYDESVVFETSGLSYVMVDS